MSKPDDDLTVTEVGVFRRVIVDALHVHGQETPAELLHRISPAGPDAMAQRIGGLLSTPTEQDLNDAACYIACQAAEIERLRAAIAAATFHPIEQPPSQPTAVVLYFAKRTWTDDDGAPISFGPIRDGVERMELAFYEDGEWLEAGTGHAVDERVTYGDPETWMPTHWMPLEGP